MSEPESGTVESPLVRVADRLEAFGPHRAISLSEKAFHTHLNLRGDPGDAQFTGAVRSVFDLDLQVEPNTFVEKNAVRAAWLGPDEWLLTGFGLEDRMSVLEGALFGIHSSLNDLSGGQTIITLSGGRAADVLSKGTTLDLHPVEFGAGQCAQTVMAHTNVLLLADEAGGNPAFDIVVRRSFADHLCRWLLDCAEEYVHE